MVLSFFILHTSFFILHPSFFIFHPSCFILHPSSFILHTSCFILHTSSFTVHASSNITPAHHTRVMLLAKGCRKNSFTIEEKRLRRLNISDSYRQVVEDSALWFSIHPHKAEFLERRRCGIKCKPSFAERNSAFASSTKVAPKVSSELQ